MKKRKFNILLNIAVLCMCVCAIAIGVYSAKTASLNVSGTIGFQAHNCKVNISAYMYGHSLTADGTPVAKPTNDSEKQYLVYGTSNTKATESAPLEINGGSESLSFNINTDSTYKGVYFSDMGESGEVEPIKIVLTITNNSSYTIYFEDTTTSPTDCTAICSNPLNVLYTDASKNSVTLTYTVVLNSNDDGTYSNLSSPITLSLGMNFSKLNTEISSTNYTFDESAKKITGVPTKEQNGGSDLIVIPSVFSDKPDIVFETLSPASFPENIVTNIGKYSKVIILDGIKSIFSFSLKYSNLKAVALPESLTSIGAFVFKSSSIISIYIPSKVTNIGTEAFTSCNKLVSANIPEGITTIESTMFAGCKLKFITIPESVTSIKALSFTTCQFTSIVIPSKVTSIENSAFSSCSKLKSITIPSNVTNIGNNAFEGCSNLTSVNFMNKTGWKAGDTAISETDLSNQSISATYLKETYKNVTWSRTDS